MRIAGVYSFNSGKEAITQQHRAELDEVLQVIEAVDAEQCKVKINKEKMLPDEIYYDPSALKEAFKKQFARKRCLLGSHILNSSCGTWSIVAFRI